MRSVHLAELKAARLTWAAVGLTFIATGFAVAIAVLMLRTAEAAVAAGLVSDEDGQALLIGPWSSLALAGLAGLAVIGASTGLVVQARRTALARMALVGATPGQVTATIMWQLSVVATAGAVIGDLIALALLQPAVDQEYHGRGIASVAANYDIGSVAIATGVAVGLALLGGWRQARRANRVPAVEALRTTDVVSGQRWRVGRFVWSLLLLGLALLIAASAIAAAPGLGVDGGDAVLQAALFAMLLVGTSLAFAAPLTVGLLTRAWTALVPSRSGTWQLARSTVVAKGERLARTVTPVMFTIGLLVGMSTLAASVTHALELRGMDGLENAGIGTLLGLIGHPLVISVAGGIGAVIMMSRQREAELALAGVTGATPRQQVAVVVLEGVVITTTATILGVVMAGFGSVTLYIGSERLGLHDAFAIDIPSLAAVILVCGAAIVAATTLPVLASLRRPAPAVIAQLVAE